MAKTNWQDPVSTEIRSTHISGLQEAVGKVEDIVGMASETDVAIALTEVYISEGDRYRIYQAPVNQRNWCSAPAPVIKKNGSVISTGFDIDYGGGAIILSPSAISTDVFTADATHTITSSASVTGSVTAPVLNLANTAAGAFSRLQLSGRTYTNIITNGNFVGTTNWVGTLLATFTAANNEVTCLADAQNDYFIQTIANHINFRGNKLYAFCLLKTSSTAVKMYINDGTKQLNSATTADSVYHLNSIIITVDAENTQLYVKVQDGRASDWDNFYVKNFGLIDLTATFGAGNEPNLATCDSLFQPWIDGTKSTAPSEIAATGKNLFDYKTALAHNSINASTGAIFAEMNFYASDYINILPSSTYRLRYGTTSTSGIAYYDINKTYISGVSLTDAVTTLTTPANARYLRMTVYYTNLLIQMLEYGATQTTFEPYQSVKSYTPILHSVPAIADTFDCVTGVHTKNVCSPYTLVADDIVSYDKTTFPNVDAISTKVFADSLYSTTLTTTMRIYGYKQTCENSIVYDTQYIGYFYLHSIKEIKIIVAPDTYADLAACKAALAGTVIYYQLATPTVTYYPAKTIPCPANTTISQDNIISDYGFYATGLTISDSTYPIVTLAEVVKIDQTTGAETQIVLSTCTVAAGELSFTSTALADGDLVWYRYYRSPFYTIGQIDYTRTASLAGQVNENSKKLGELSEQVNLNEELSTKLKHSHSTFTDNDTEQSFTDLFCTEESRVDVIITDASVPQGLWSVESFNGYFTITSTKSETDDIDFDYWIMKV